MGKTFLPEIDPQKVLDSLYEKAIDGIPGSESAEEFAKEYLAENSTIADSIDSLVNWQLAKAGTSGFITNIGGIITLPFSVPANISSVIYIQMRMIAAIAYMCNWDVRTDRVKTLTYVCLCGKSGLDLLKQVGIKIGNKALKNAIIKNISGATLQQINKAVGFRLFTKAGEKGVVNIIDCVPFAGGLVGAAFDISTTKGIASIAKSVFYSKGLEKNNKQKS